MNSRRWFLSLILGLGSLLLLQFFIFRIAPVYNLCLKTYLYDNGWWLQKKAKIVILGSSSAMNSLACPLISKMNHLDGDAVVNFGMNGATGFEIANSYKKYVARFGHPEKLYLSLTPELCYENTYVKKEYEKILLSWEQWKVLENEDGISNNYFFPINIFFSSLQFSSMLKFKQYHFQLDATRKNRGYQPSVHVEFDKDKIPSRFYPQRRDLFPISRFQMQALADIQTMAQKNGTEFFIVLTPLYESLYQFRKENEKDQADFIQLFNELFSPVRVVGSTNPAVYGLKYDHFINFDHLAASGAELYTAKAFSDLKAHEKLRAKKLESLASY